MRCDGIYEGSWWNSKAHVICDNLAMILAPHDEEGYDLENTRLYLEDALCYSDDESLFRRMWAEHRRMIRDEKEVPIYERYAF